MAQQFRRVIMMGATQTGKTTLLSKAICGDFDEYYTPTAHAQTFYDCKRRLEIIDTPGVADAVLTDNFDAFKQDILVAKMLGSGTVSIGSRDEKASLAASKDLSITQKEIDDEARRLMEDKNRANPMAGPDGIEIDTKIADIYVIVYTPEPRSKYIARSLKKAIRDNQSVALKQNPIFFVINDCHLERPPHPQPAQLKKWEEYAVRGASTVNKDDRTGEVDQYAANHQIMVRIFAPDNKMDVGDPSEKQTESSENMLFERTFSARADTGFGLHQLFDELAACKLTGSTPKRYAMGGGDKNKVKKEESRESCSIEACAVM